MSFPDALRFQQHRLKLVPEAKLTKAASSTKVGGDNLDQQQQTTDMSDIFMKYLQLPFIDQHSSTLMSSSLNNPKISNETATSPNVNPTINTSAGSDQRRLISASPSSLREIPFKCPLCGLIYRTQTHLNEHMRKEHSVLIWLKYLKKKMLFQMRLPAVLEVNFEPLNGAVQIEFSSSIFKRDERSSVESPLDSLMWCLKQE